MTFMFVCFNLLKNTEWPVKVGTLLQQNQKSFIKKRELWFLTCHRKMMESRDRGRRGGFSSNYQRHSNSSYHRSGTRRCTLCKLEGHLRFECMKEVKFEDEDGTEWVKWTLTRKEYELVKREREKERVKKEMLMKKEKLRDEMKMKREIELEIAREKRERRKSRRTLGSESDEESEGMSDDDCKKGGNKSLTKGVIDVNRNKSDENRLVKLLEDVMTRQDEMMRELEEVKSLQHDSGERDKSKEKRRSVRRKSVGGVIDRNDSVVAGSNELAEVKGKQKGVMVEATYVPRAALEEDEYDDNEEVIGEVPIATEKLCNALNRAWLAREKMREKKVLGPVRHANVKRMVLKHAEDIDESVRIQAMINVVSAYGGEVLDNMGFEELVHELGVIYK